MNTFKMAGIAAMALLLVACATDAGPKQQLGTLLGSIGGAVAGAQIGDGKGQLAATAIGTLLGAYVGSEIGESLDRADRLAMQQTTQNSLENAPSGTTSTWQNPDSGNYGTVTPQPSYQTSAGQYCREFRQTVSVGESTEDAYGTACRQPDGSWQIVSG